MPVEVAFLDRRVAAQSLRAPHSLGTRGHLCRICKLGLGGLGVRGEVVRLASCCADERSASSATCALPHPRTASTDSKVPALADHNT